MKTIVIYHSQTGFTKRYAEWIAENVNADCLELCQAQKKDLSLYQTIIFGSWAFAGSIRKIGWFKKNINEWKSKKMIIFCVGASPIDCPEVKQALNNFRSDLERENVKVFYCPGGINYERMPATSKLMMKIFLNGLKAKKEKTQTETEMLKMISSSYDISNPKYIEPILEELNLNN